MVRLRKETAREPRKRQSDDELLEELCSKLQTLGPYRGPRTPEEGKLVMECMRLRAEVLSRMKRKAVRA